MLDLLESITRRLGWARRDGGERFSRAYKCRCGSAVFFRNTQCLTCKTALGFVPATLALVATDPDATSGTVIAAGHEPRYRYCGNRESPALCNWLIEADDPSSLCRACRLNRTIPNLDDADNQRYWAAIELAKRRLVSQLLMLGLPVKSRVEEDAERGLMFDFLRSPAEGPAVMTGHADGLITLNVEEADDSRREKIRHAMREPYRTLLGHFRHEVGHYYWDRLVSDTAWLEPVRTVFGDERASYAEALERHYKSGPPPNWADAFITSYATMHPWEDWAETWAHYLHVIDSVYTALGFGLDADDLESTVTPFTREDLYAPDDPDAPAFLSLLNSWIEVVTVLNEVARSMGHRDFYPFVMSRPMVAKLQLVHMIVTAARSDSPAKPKPVERV
jgi:hypothetical protein